MSQFAQLFTHMCIKGFQRMLLKASLALTLADLSFVYGPKDEISCSSAESSDVSLLSMS